jgi:hypothetical protein
MPVPDAATIAGKPTSKAQTTIPCRYGSRCA